MGSEMCIRDRDKPAERVALGVHGNRTAVDFFWVGDLEADGVAKRRRALRRPDGPQGDFGAQGRSVH